MTHSAPAPGLRRASVGNPGSANRWRTSAPIATVMRSAIAFFGWAAATRSEPAEQEVIMTLIHHYTGHTTASMRRDRLSQVLAAVLGAGMVLIVIGPILLGMAIQQRTITPPELDVQLGRLQVIASAMHTPDCDRYVTPCQPELRAPPAQEFYVIWVFSRTGQLTSPEEWQTGTRLLTLRLRNQFNGPRDLLIR